MSQTHPGAAAQAVVPDAPPGHAHEGPIRTPRQLIAAVVASFLVPIVVIVLLVQYVDFGARTGAGSTGMDEDAVARRLQPVGQVQLAVARGDSGPRAGEEVYRTQCAACHGAGLVGAPRLGDAAAWAPRIATGYAALLGSALKGKGAMTPQGGGSFSDLEIGRAVVHMANQSGGRLAEPAGAASAPASAAQ